MGALMVGPRTGLRNLLIETGHLASGELPNVSNSSTLPHARALGFRPPGINPPLTTGGRPMIGLFPDFFLCHTKPVTS